MAQEHHHPEKIFMQRAFELALLGKGLVSPNPLVGCVIVHHGKIIGEGWHQKYGQAHAEVNAIKSVIDKSLLRESTLFVNLEPCSHFGKTPPCADLIIREKLKRVVISNTDPNPLVAGNGIKKLTEAGVHVEIGLLQEEGRILNRRFFMMMEKHRPYIILKWAQTADGFIARENFDSKWISNESSRQLVHKWRTEEDAILVGKSTALHDNPKLNIRDWTGRNPVRIVIDSNLELDSKLHLFDNSQRTLRFNLIRDHIDGKNELIKIDEQNFLYHLLEKLFELKIQSVIVEGGSRTLQSFIDGGVWDEARIFTATKTKFDKGIRAPHIAGKIESEEMIGDDQLKIISN